MTTDRQIDVKELIPGSRLRDSFTQKVWIIVAMESVGNYIKLTLHDSIGSKTETVTRTLEQIRAKYTPVNDAFTGDASLVRTLTEAYRLNHAYLFNSLFATETSLIDPLPHQLIAVYGIASTSDQPTSVQGMLAHQPLRFLLADDAGAGKTIMAGLYIREMLLRRLIRRILVIPPAGLVGNWQRELSNLFRLRFRILDSSAVRDDENPFADDKENQLIVSMDTARQPKVRAALNNGLPFDLVVCDEAHKLGARFESDLSPNKSQRYETVEEIAACCTNLLLLTATPHMGKDDQYFFLWKLLDDQQFSTLESLRKSTPEVRRPHLIRRMKEEMVNFEGKPLYTLRKSKTIQYPLTAAERELYDAVSNYVSEYYSRATTGNRSSVGLALAVIQRRLASSAWALWKSLSRREQKLSRLLDEMQKRLVSEEEVERRQAQLPYEDIRAKMTGDEEEAVDGQEEAEIYDEQIMGATTQRTAADLATELNAVRALVPMARAVYDNRQESKFDRFKTLLKEHPNTKILIFTEHRDTADFLQERLESMGYTGRLARIDGSMDYRERERQANRFREDDCPYLIATDAAGEGINLQFCWCLINYDIPWNPARLEQRMGRVHRYKQTHEVLLLSLVAEQTREGVVLKTLLDKLELIRAQLGNDKVFDIIGEQMGNVSLADLVFHATVKGDTEAATAKIESTFDLAAIKKQYADQETQVEVTEVRDLLSALRTEQADAETKRMMPAYVRTFWEKATALLDTAIEGDIQSRFHFVTPPEWATGALKSYPDELTDKLTFSREIALPRFASQPQALYIHPGEPLFDALWANFVGRYESEGQKGAVFYDLFTDAPYLFYLAKVQIVRPFLDRNAEPTDERQTLAVMMTGLRVDAFGNITQVPAHLLLSLETEGSTDVLDEERARLIDLARSTTAVEGYVLDNLASPKLAELQTTAQARLPQHKEQIRRACNYKLSEQFEQKKRLKENVEKKVPTADTKLKKLEAEIQRTESNRDLAITALEREIEMMEITPVQLYTRALVLPLPPRVAAEQRDAQAEKIALETVYRQETAKGAVLEDVSASHLARGFDLLATYPDGSVRYIEVKGRTGANQIHLTENEWVQAANHRDKYWLYVVYGCETADPQLHCIADPFAKLLTGDGGRIINPGEIYRHATEER